jgi:Tfp pilus assembly protein PilZ
MIEKFEKRDDARMDYISPLQVMDLQSGETYEARMFNYSSRGIYFESDGVFEKGTNIYICIQNSPYILPSRILEYCNAEIMWVKNLKGSLSKYGYGIQLVSDSGKKDLDSNAVNKSKESRAHQRKPFFRTVPFGNGRVLSEGITENISASGVFVATEKKLKVGQSLKLHLPLKKGKTEEVVGRIVWINEAGFGLEFKNPNGSV